MHDCNWIWSISNLLPMGSSFSHTIYSASCGLRVGVCMKCSVTSICVNNWLNYWWPQWKRPARICNLFLDKGCQDENSLRQRLSYYHDSKAQVVTQDEEDDPFLKMITWGCHFWRLLNLATPQSFEKMVWSIELTWSRLIHWFRWWGGSHMVNPLSNVECGIYIFYLTLLCPVDCFKPKSRLNSSLVEPLNSNLSYFLIDQPPLCSYHSYPSVHISF